MSNRPAAEQLDHRLESGKRDVEEGTLIIESALQHDGMEVRVPEERVSKGLMCDDGAGEKRSARSFVVEPLLFAAYLTKERVFVP